MQVGDYIVLRNGDIETESTETDILLEHLKSAGFISSTKEEPGIKILFRSQDPKSRMNLICMLFMRGGLINKAIDKENAFIVRKGFLMHIGMMGEFYDTTRTFLVENLDGNSSYRYQEQRDNFNAARREEAKKRREAKHHDDFIAL